MKKTIYFFNENHEYGGAEKMFMWLSKSLYKEGYDIRYCMLYRNDDIDTSPIPTDYLDFKFYNSYLLRNLWYFIIGFFKIAQYIRKNNVKYIVCFGFNSFYILGILKYFFKFQLIASERGDPSMKRFSGVRKKLFENCDGAVFQTDGARRFYENNKDENSYIISNPVIIPEDEWKEPINSLNVISVGRIDFEQKRQDLLVKSFKMVVETIPEATLTIVGKGFDMDALRQLIVDNGLENRIELIGFKKDVLSELRKANVFVLSSDFEGIPNSLLEAMSYGMPVISTNCSPGGAAFLIKNEVNGLLVPRGNECALADGIIRLLKNSEERKKLGAKARNSMKRFDEQNIIKQWEEVINKSFC